MVHAVVCSVHYLRAKSLIPSNTLERMLCDIFLHWRAKYLHLKRSIHKLTSLAGAFALLPRQQSYRIGAISSFHFPSTRDTIYIICLMFIALNANDCDCLRSCRHCSGVAFVFFFFFCIWNHYRTSIHIDELFNSNVCCLEDMLHCCVGTQVTTYL